MSRIAKAPIVVPIDVAILFNAKNIIIKRKASQLSHTIHSLVKVDYTKDRLLVSPFIRQKKSWIQAGTTRSLLQSMIIGITKGFTKKLQLIGIGYRASIEKNKEVCLFLGFSHPIRYTLPIGITAKCLSQTEIIIKGIDKKLVGQVAADLRSYRPPEPYKGKGIRYCNEKIRTKEAKKK